MKYSIILFLFVVMTTSCKAQEYRAYEKENALIGEVDDKDSNRINFYFDRLSKQSVIELDLSDTDFKLKEGAIKGCFKDVTGKLLKCEEFKVEGERIVLQGVDYKVLLGNRLAIKLFFDPFDPIYFVFIERK
ncbi:MAG: hypothetical protein R6U95_01030 [Bacteroidales bacterium]